MSLKLYDFGEGFFMGLAFGTYMEVWIKNGPDSPRARGRDDASTVIELDENFAVGVTGAGLLYDDDSANTIVGGTIDSLEFQNGSGAAVLTITNFGDIDAAAFFTLLSGLLEEPIYDFIVNLLDDDTIVTGSNLAETSAVGAGNDIANMGDGDDHIIKFDPGNLTYDGGDGSDTLSFAEEIGQTFQNPFTQQLIVNLADGTGQNPYGGTLDLTSVENVIGTFLSDVITGNDDANIIGDGQSDNGPDIVNAMGGDDIVKISPFANGGTIDGGDGHDTLFFQYSNFGAAVVNTLDLNDQAQNTGIFGGGTFTNFENFEVGNDFAPGLASLDFRGDGNANHLSVRDGDIIVDLGDGDDSFSMLNGFASGGTVEGGDGFDSLDFIGFFPNTLDLTDQSNNTGVFQGGSFTGFEDITATSGNFTFIGDDERNTVTGELGVYDFKLGGGRDIATGGALADRLEGQKGKDKLNGAEGDDTLIGGNGKDTLSGGKGEDILRGGNGKDKLKGNKGDDELKGGSKADKFFFADGAGSDTILDFEDGVDLLHFKDVTSVSNFGDLTINRISNTETQIDYFDGSNNVTLTVLGNAPLTIDQGDFIF